jgi:hypothetical protein
MNKETEMEIWKDIPGYEGKYQVSNLGKVKSLSRSFIRNGAIIPVRERIMTHHTGKRGYPEVKLCKGGKCSTKLVHILLANAFIPNKSNKPHTGKIKQFFLTLS